MTIAEAQEKCKSAISKIPRDVLILAILFLASSASFGLGYLAGVDVGQGSSPAPLELATETALTEGHIIASRNGTKYYLPSCAGADKISESNKVWFASAVDAAKAGYAPSANCKGL